MEYNVTFAQRADSYTYAVKQYPDTLKEEFRVAVEMCAPLGVGDCLVNIPAACIEVEALLPAGVSYLPFETSAEFARRNTLPVAAFGAIPLKDEAASHILCLATLHHATVEERKEFYKESWRILKPGGRLIIGDVALHSPQASWLNEFVHLHNSLGHRGLFWKGGDVADIEQAGFRVETCMREYEWRSASREAEIDFVRHLFGLDLATDAEIAAGLDRYFPGRPAATIPWALRYFIALKPIDTPALPLEVEDRVEILPQE